MNRWLTLALLVGALTLARSARAQATGDCVSRIGLACRKDPNAEAAERAAAAEAARRAAERAASRDSFSRAMEQRRADSVARVAERDRAEREGEEDVRATHRFEDAARAEDPVGTRVFEIAPALVSKYAHLELSPGWDPVAFEFDAAAGLAYWDLYEFVRASTPLDHDLRTVKPSGISLQDALAEVSYGISALVACARNSGNVAANCRSIVGAITRFGAVDLQPYLGAGDSSASWFHQNVERLNALGIPPGWESRPVTFSWGQVDLRTHWEAIRAKGMALRDAWCARNDCPRIAAAQAAADAAAEAAAKAAADRDSAQRAARLAGRISALPELGAQLATRGLFEGGADGVPHSQRVYVSEFDPATTRYVWLYLTFQFYPGYDGVTAPFSCQCTSEGGASLGSLSWRVQPLVSQDRYEAVGKWGWPTPGKWAPGTYHIECSGGAGPFARLEFKMRESVDSAAASAAVARRDSAERAAVAAAALNAFPSLKARLVGFGINEEGFAERDRSADKTEFDSRTARFIAIHLEFQFPPPGRPRTVWGTCTWTARGSKGWSRLDHFSFDVDASSTSATAGSGFGASDPGTWYPGDYDIGCSGENGLFVRTGFTVK